MDKTLQAIQLPNSTPKKLWFLSNYLDNSNGVYKRTMKK